MIFYVIFANVSLEMKEDISNIELRSEEFQEVLGQTPNWLIRSGITVILIVVTILLIGSYFYKYPDIVEARVVLTTLNPPASILSRSNGQLKELYVKNGEEVIVGTSIALIENAAEIEDVNSLKNKLLVMNEWINSFRNILEIEFDNDYQLGELQPFYELFLRLFVEYNYQKEKDYFQKRILFKQKQLQSQRNYFKMLTEQKAVLSEIMSIEHKQLRRDSLLLSKFVISDYEMENSELDFSQKEYSYKGAKTSLANAQINITQLEQDILALKLERDMNLNKLESDLLQAYNNLIAQISLWEQNYLVKSPIEGTVSYSEYWSTTQNVQIGDVVATILPKEKGQVVVKAKLKNIGAGRVLKGQKVNLKLDNFPYMEYGFLRGSVQNISKVSEEQIYYVDIKLTNGLTTNYKQVLNFSQRMEGNAEIITKDRRLLERFIEPILSIFYK